MTLNFCPNCKRIIIQTGNCTCGFEIKELQIISSETQKLPEQKGQGILIEEKITTGFPHICKKCGHNECLIKDVGVSVSDEAGIYLFKCLKCSYIERQADGSCNM
jgi:DNA-directed RNA polymerase subunit M/transcription elongation factor TFIIS